MSISIQAQWLPVAIPKVNEEYKSLFATLDLTNPVTVDLSLIQSQTFLKSVRGMFFDNSIGTAAVRIATNRTRQVLIIPSLSQAYLPLLVPDPVSLIFSSTSAELRGVQLLNFSLGPVVWKV